jgi:hypothetical protein
MQFVAHFGSDTPAQTIADDATEADQRTQNSRGWPFQKTVHFQHVSLTHEFRIR